jgi:hypothetical protein
MRGKKKHRLKGICMEILLTYGEREFDVMEKDGEFGVLFGEGLIDWVDADGSYVKLTPKALELIRS